MSVLVWGDTIGYIWFYACIHTKMIEVYLHVLALLMCFDCDVYVNMLIPPHWLTYIQQHIFNSSSSYKQKLHKNFHTHTHSLTFFHWIWRRNVITIFCLLHKIYYSHTSRKHSFGIVILFCEWSKEVIEREIENHISSIIYSHRIRFIHFDCGIFIFFRRS